MYDNKKEAHKDFLYTSRVIFLFISIVCLPFLAATKGKAVTYIAINLSPEIAVAYYKDSKEINEYVVEKYYNYTVFDSSSHIYTVRLSKRYDSDFLELENKEPIELLYSKWFPSISYLKEKIIDLKGNFTVFSISLSAFLFCLIFSVYFTVRIHGLNKNKYV